MRTTITLEPRPEVVHGGLYTRTDISTLLPSIPDDSLVVEEETGRWWLTRVDHLVDANGNTLLPKHLPPIVRLARLGAKGPLRVSTSDAAPKLVTAAEETTAIVGQPIAPEHAILLPDGSLLGTETTTFVVMEGEVYFSDSAFADPLAVPEFGNEELVLLWVPPAED